jgi:hypothetical protein
MYNVGIDWADQKHDITIVDHTGLSNSLRSTLKAYYPEYIGFFNNVACPTSLAYPD